MLKVRIPWNIVSKIGKYLLAVLIITLAGYIGYMSYYFATNQPHEIRVTNLTGSSATVSWYTNRPDKGLVALKEKNSFIPFLAGLGSKLGYDDRDYAKALSDLADKATKQAEKDVDADYEVTLDSESLKSVKVSKKGMYYVHHVTIENLKEETEYYFRVGNGIFWWNVKADNQKYSEIEAPTVTEAKLKTYKDPNEILAPDPAYGKVLSIARNKDGFVMENPSTDSVVFVNAWKLKKNEFSSYQSSVTNLTGGWTIDKSNFRNTNGVTDVSYVKGEDKLYVYAQLENLSTVDLLESSYGVDDAPVKSLVINNDYDAKVIGNVFDKVKLSVIGGPKVDPIAKIITKSYAACSKDDETTCPAGSRWSSSSCKCTTEKPVYTPDPDNNTTSNYCVYLTCSGGQKKKGCSCVDPEPEDKGGRDEAPSQSAPVAQTGQTSGQGGTNTSGNTSSTLDFTCKTGPNGAVSEPIEVDGKLVCPNKITQTAAANGNVKCEGKLANSCEADAGCFCQMSDGSGYGRLAGESCRPQACASVINGDVLAFDAAGNPTYRTYKANLDSDPELEDVLCGSNTTLPGCELAKNFVTTRSGDIICNKGYKLTVDAKSCESDGTPIGGNGNGSDGNSGGSGSSGNSGNGASGAPIGGNSSQESCNGVGRIALVGGGCGCRPGYVESGLNCIPIAANLTPVVPTGQCKRGEKIFNCGSDTAGNSCSEKPLNDNNGCGTGYECLYATGGQGYCVEKGVTLSTSSKYSDEYIGGLAQDCYLLVDDKTSNVIQVNITDAWNDKPTTSASDQHWEKAWVSMCLKATVQSQNNELLKLNNISLVSKVSAKSDVELETEGTYLAIFPESGTYDVQIGSELFKNIYVDKNNKHFFFIDNNGVTGYQSPKDPKKLSKNDDVLLPASGAVVTLYEKAKNQTLKIEKGMNIVSFNYLPSRVEGKNMNARQLMRILNSSGTKVTRITTFEGGKWLGGIAYDSNNSEIVGTDFAVIPGKGYLIVSNTTYTATVPGYGIKNSIPVALSSGWNLIGVNGFDKTYTASTLIDSVNSINELKANNVTWWPTSKGRYETFQKSEGVEYGFDFPILKDVGYFLRVSEFNVEDQDTKSIIWNPGGSLHGEPGSGKTK